MYQPLSREMCTWYCTQLLDIHLGIYFRVYAQIPTHFAFHQGQHELNLDRVLLVPCPCVLVLYKNEAEYPA